MTQRIAQIYRSGGNIIKFLKSMDDRTTNNLEDILISYDFQAGSYILAYEQSARYLDDYTSQIAGVLNGLGPFGTCIEAGCGEATTLAVLGRKLPRTTVFGGFDIAWSRVKLGVDFARRHGVEAELFCGDLFHIPLENHSVDVIYTSHSIEPNGGREIEAIVELARVAAKWLVLLEPAYDLAGPEARMRMEEHGYVKDLAKCIRQLGLELVRHELFSISANPLNPTGLYLIRIAAQPGLNSTLRYQCPVSGMPLDPGPTAFFSADSLLAYPILAGVPYLLPSHAILATKYSTPETDSTAQ